MQKKVIAIDTNKWIDHIKDQAVRLDHYDDLDAIVNAVGDAKYVLLGEASHGTSEFYTLRTEISKRLIEQKDFSFIAVEGDWPSCYTLNRFIKHFPSTSDNVEHALHDFRRWPTWMWANQEIIALAAWLREHNRDKKDNERVGFHGIDVYSLWESIDEIIAYLKQTSSKELETAIKTFSCFEPFNRDEQTYGVSAAFLSDDCTEEVVQLLKELHEKRQYESRDEEDLLSAELNALVAVDAERYYRAMVKGGPESWNIRDRHMVDTLNRLMDYYGPEAKVIVWEHNTHIGDARATDMADDGMVNVGQLLREQHGVDHVFAVGFGTHHGSVIASRAWGAAIERMTVPPAWKNSWEDVMHRAGNHDKMIIFDRSDCIFNQPIGHRAIGVVYHPESEWGNYVPSIMCERYDAFIYVDETEALNPVTFVEALV